MLLLLRRRHLTVSESLLSQLEQYSPWDAAERTAQASLLALLTQPTAFDRCSYAPGHITGSAWILADTGQVGLIYHRWLNRWLQPGGHPEPDETDGLSTALREVAEELGLVVAPSQARLFDLDVHRIPATATQPEHLHFDIRYLCRVPQQPLTGGSDAVTARWFSAEELLDMELEASLRRMLEKGLAAG